MAKVKICGLTNPDLVRFTAEAGADWIGFMFAPSPRQISFEAARDWFPLTGGARPVAVFVDPSDADIETAASIGFTLLQLHGSETPQRVAGIRRDWGLDVWKVIKVKEVINLAQALTYTEADGYLLDAAPPSGAAEAGGHGQVFDWSILKDWTLDRPWLLSGGLTPLNVAAAIRQTGAQAVDVSSGVERQRGLKDESLIAAFLAAAKQG
jgi:phosphoribosylanthranilate isomerase